MGVGITLCLGLTPLPSSNWGRGEEEEELPLEAPFTCSYDALSLSSPYALPLFCLLLCKCPHGLSPTLSASKSTGEPEECGEC